MNRISRLFFPLILLLILAACQDDQPEVLPTPAGPVLSGVVKVEVETDGFYRLTPTQLQAAGATIESFALDKIRLSHNDTAVPILVTADSLIFYGQAPTNRYTAVRSYLLEIGQAGAMMAETTIAATASKTLEQLPLTRHLEENNRYEAATLTNTPADQLDLNSADPWYWAKINSNDTLAIPLNLPQVGDGSATVTLHAWGDSNNPEINLDHDVDLVINNQRVGTIQWEGLQFHTGEYTVPAGTLQQGENELIVDNEIDGASFVDIQMLNWLQIRYLAPPVAVADYLSFDNSQGQVTLTGFSQQPQLFDISHPNNPTLLTGWQPTDDGGQLAVTEAMHITAVGPQGYQTPTISPVRESDWHNSEHQADLIIITPDAFAETLTPLIEARTAQGLNVVMVPLAEIYDEFGFGAATPNSIQSFVTYAYNNWQAPQPAYLLLVGDASSDYRNYLGEASPTHIPSLMVPVQFSGETVSDARLADVNEDMLPDLAVGRWPVNNIKEVAALVERTLAYEAGTAVERAIFATDNTETQFVHIAQRLSDQSNLQSDIYDGPSASEVTDEINRGAWLATYIGHGSVYRWGRDDVFNLESVTGLSSKTPPIMLQLTCLTGLFSAPETSLSETMLLHENGPVLIVAATSLTLSTHQEPFAQSLLQNLQEPSVMRIGDALQIAKQGLNVANNNGLREISDTFILLGDPSTPILRPEPIHTN